MSSFIVTATRHGGRRARLHGAPRCCAALLATAWRLATADADPALAVTEPPRPKPADEQPTTAEPPRTDRDHSAAETAGAPVPGEESGRIDLIDPGDSALRRAARSALLPPKLALAVVLAPVRVVVWAQDRYQLEDLYYRTFYSRDRTIGLFPTATYESDFGYTAGAGFVDHDLFGAREDLALHATTGEVSGTSYRDSLLAAFRTGDRVGPVLELGVSGNFDRRPADHFYGIGNRDLAPAPASPIDPRRDDTAVEVAHRYREARVAGFVDARLADALHVRALGSLTDLAFSRGDTGPALEMVYDPAAVVGYTGVRHAYGELELRYDGRRRASLHEREGVRATGGLGSVYAGRVHRLDGGVDYWRYGAELQQLLRLGYGPRMLAVRLHADAVSGSLDEVPFTELPALGGAQFLRGYPYERFRDRVAAVGTIAYEWDVSFHLRASVFAAAGRVFPSLSEVALGHVRAGYGVSLSVLGAAGFLLEGSLASSLDGGLVAGISFNPVLDARPRWR